ncbi:hypothetical protein BTO05_03140 [Winogradskyella sp. PC-19]|uniref:hypothetical protein n=1 Tax=unclassified Winogradskyella TaxID=2615021 RepID=UPI000B3CCA94|nr:MULTISPECIES: hypothetical protein [unclassified Winogradskyella]ARV08679.1 hypothetical protein BTO05_03140 [Winogradskyella sp. PC-19]RZN82089.1 MAG: hypothetical protein EVB12_03400 [Winogradskyella sp.]
MQIKKILKIIAGIVIFITLPSLLFFGFLYIKYDEDLPTGKSGIEADNLATKMLDGLNYEAYKNTDYIEWTFKGRQSYKWYKTADSCEVKWKNFKVILDFKNKKKSKVFVANQQYNGIEKQKYIDKATAYFNNDSFWLVAPYKVFDKDTQRKIVKTKDNKNALLITYKSGGSTPGDSYLWHLDKNNIPTSYQMWVNILPIDGLEASWSDWTTTKSGAQLPTFHKLLFLGLEITDIKTK